MRTAGGHGLHRILGRTNLKPVVVPRASYPAILGRSTGQWPPTGPRCADEMGLIGDELNPVPGTHQTVARCVLAEAPRSYPTAAQSPAPFRP